MTIAPSLTSADLAVAMAAATRGDVVTPDHPSYPAACFGYASAGEDAPEIVVIAADACDVAAAVRLAARSGRRVAVQATGHTAPAGGVGTILVVTRLLARVSIDPEARTARVGAGSSWRQVLAAARAFGLAPVPSPDGDTARSPRVRRFAFAPDHVREFEVVTTAGAILQVDADSDPERFGALRAGRAAFGLVTAMTIDLQPAEGHYAAGLWFSGADAGPVLRRWRTWLAELPPTCSTSITQLRAPDSIRLPDQLREQAVLHVRFAFLGDPSEGIRLLAPLRTIAPPLLDSMQEISWGATDRGLLTAFGPAGTPIRRRHGASGSSSLQRELAVASTAHRRAPVAGG